MEKMIRLNHDKVVNNVVDLNSVNPDHVTRGRIVNEALKLRFQKIKMKWFESGTGEL